MIASFFDIDGTLIKGFMISSFPRYLMERGLVDKESLEKLEEIIRLYSSKKISYRETALRCPRLYSRCVKGLEEEDVTSEAKGFVKPYLKKNVQPYAFELVKLMKSFGMTVGISGSPIEVISIVGEIFGFDASYGSVFEIKNGIYTGRVKQNMIIKESKDSIVKDLVRQRRIDLRESFAFGDTEQDLALLSKVDCPIALNPNGKLLSVAKKRGWTVFSSKDDVVKSLSKLKVRQS